MAQLVGLKIGDTIKCLQAYTRDAYDMFKVERLTDTRAVCSAIGAVTNYQGSFKLDNGLMIGSGDNWNRRYGSIATEADFAAIAMRNRIRAARSAMERLAITEANIEAVETLLKASKP
jgi:hypothetical protein